MRALLTGANGFAGRHLLRHLGEAGDDLTGLIKPGTEPPGGLLAVAEADIRDGHAVG